MEKVSITMTPDEVVKIRKLIKRDEAMAIVQGEYLDRCPVCKRMIPYIKMDETKFCQFCGQRIDPTLYQF